MDKFGLDMSNALQSIKDEYVKYYRDVPVQKYAAMYIGRDEDTIIRWRNEDPKFADAVQRAKANWIRKKVIATKAEFALERLESAVFSPKAVISHDVDIYAETRETLKEFLTDEDGNLYMGNPRDKIREFLDEHSPVYPDFELDNAVS